MAAKHERLAPADLLARARFRECLDTLNGDMSPKAVLIRMRAMLLLGEHHEIVRADFLDVIANLPQAERARAMALLSTAYFRSDMRIAAENARLEAYRLGDALAEPSVLADIRYYHAFQAWAENDLDLADRLVEQILCDETFRAKALELRGWIAGRRGDYDGQIRHLRAAWEAIHHEDVWTRAAILHALSALARELYDESLAFFIERSAENLPWTAETRDKESSVYRYLGWCAALGGRTHSAFEYFTRAAQNITSDAHRVLIDLDRACVARWCGEPRTADEFYMRASIRAESVDWLNAGEARMGMLILAEMEARNSPQRAKRWLERYCDIATPMPRVTAFGSGDLRRRAHEEFTAGVVYRSLGMRHEALNAFKTAFNVWDRIGYRWRAALAAFNLGQITARPHYYDIAREYIDRSVPDAFFTRIIGPYRAQAFDPVFQKLPEGQKEVLHCFLEGLTNKVIAERLQISESLVKRRLSAIYRAFGAESSRDFWPLIIKRGLI